jgi:hypothetical protein
MQTGFQVIGASEFIRLDVHELLDFEASKKAFRGLVLACRKRGLDSALLDLRSLPVLPRPHFTPNELADLVSTFRHAGFSKNQHLAILYETDAHHGIRSFAFINKLRGLQVRPFTEFEKALEWLQQLEERVGEEPDEMPVPISLPNRKAKKLSSNIAHRKAA